MAVIAQDLSQRLSNWLKYEYDPSSGVTREALAKSAITGGAIYSGSVLDATGAFLTAANAANATYILIDDLSRPSAASFTQVLVLARGYAKVADQALLFSGTFTDAQKASAFAALAAKNIFVVKQI